MDIGEVKKQGDSVEILHPRTSEPTGLVIDVVSYKDDRVKKVARACNDARLKRRGRARSQEEIDKEEIAITAAAVTGWAWGQDADGNEALLNGEKPEFNESNLKKVLAAEWVREQVDAACMDDRRFFTS